uniref:Alpha-1,3-glucosyltransferase n=1 Tax=Kalanchoe fedtschenkoi TaxID=63787 RepID=A0A7N0RCU0_KALFE
MAKSKPTAKSKASSIGEEAASDDDRSSQWLTGRGVIPPILCVAVFGLLVRAGVSLHSYSGAADPPKYGDFEAQRHWMEITTNLPASEWYRNSSVNDLRYWGLDYPPLTAYQSYVHGLWLKSVLPESVQLFTSRGHESHLGKLLMRWTVLSSDVLVFVPAALCFILAYYSQQNEGRSDMVWHSAMVLLNPCLILIDHGHFQYNCISLGLTVGAVAAILTKRELLAGVLFSLALNHKQMSAYFAPAFFSYLLGKCLKHSNPLIEVLKLGFVVIGTFVLLWWPYLQSKEAFFEVLSRLAPFERGIYEDYVANFWCTASVLIKWKKLFSMHFLKLVSLTATVVTCLPSMVHQIRYPSYQSFLYGMLNSSFAFYFFSFQVHEKSILLPLLPASLLAFEEPFVYSWFTHFAMLSMFPLLIRDKLIVPFAVLSILFTLLFRAPCRKQDSTKQIPTSMKLLPRKLLTFFSVFLHIIYVTLTPPKRYPFLFEAIIMLHCFIQFVLLAIYTNVKQWNLPKPSSSADNKKKLL